MLTYVIRRLLWAVVLFIAVTMVTYMIFYVIPANPARLACGQRATEECITNASHRLGLDRPVPIQYGMFLKRLIDRPLARPLVHEPSRREPDDPRCRAGDRVARLRRRDPLDAAGASDRDPLGPATEIDARPGCDRLRAARDLAARRLDRSRAPVLDRLPARVVPECRLLRLHQPARPRAAVGRCNGPTTSCSRGSHSRSSSPPSTCG